MRIRRCPACFAAHHLPAAADLEHPGYCAVCRAPLDAHAAGDLSVPGEHVHRAVRSGLDANPVGPAFRRTASATQPARPAAEGSRQTAGQKPAAIAATPKAHGTSPTASETDTAVGGTAVRRARPLAIAIRTTCNIPAGAMNARPLPHPGQVTGEPDAPLAPISLSFNPVQADAENASGDANTQPPTDQAGRHRKRQAVPLAIGAALALAVVVQALLHDPRRLTLLAEISPVLANAAALTCRALPCTRYPARPSWDGARLVQWRWTTSHDQPTLVVTGQAPLPRPHAMSGRDNSPGSGAVRQTPPIEVVDVNDRRLLVIPALPVDTTTPPGQRRSSTSRPLIRPSGTTEVWSDRTVRDATAVLTHASGQDAAGAADLWGWEVRVTFHAARAHVHEDTGSFEQRFDAEALQARVGGIRLLER